MSEDTHLKKLLFVYAGHPGGTTDHIRRHIEGALKTVAANIEIKSCWAPDAQASDVLWADGILLATPEHFGYMAGKMKDFFDRTFYPTEGKTIGKPYALVVSAGNDGAGTVQSVERIVKGYGWKAIQPPVVCVGSINEKALKQAEMTALTLAIGLVEGVF